mgnify:FL=1
MTQPTATKRIWGWFFFDWASQPYHTILLTFIFGPFFADIATQHFMAQGMAEQGADARAQAIWSACLTVTGLLVGFGGPVLGAVSDTAERRMPWIVGFSALYIIGASALWWTNPDGSNLLWALIFFGIGFVGAEYALIFTNAQLPTLGSSEQIGRISGSGFAFGYAGGLLALALVLVFFVEQANGRTVAGLPPAFGLEAEAREGTRFTGPFAALWFAVFMVPYFLWVREVRSPARPSLKAALARLGRSLRSLPDRKSLATYLGASMLYRDGLNGLYGFGGTYALLVLNWEVTQVGVFGIVSILAAALFSWVGGRLDVRFGPKPVVIAAILGLILVCVVVLNMTRNSFFGVALGDASGLPDAVFFGCGVLIGGLGGVVQAASRTLMVRHADPAAPTESFGLYGLSGRATSFLAPAMIGAVTAATGDARLGVAPLIGLFTLGLVLLLWVKHDGDRAGQ